MSLLFHRVGVIGAGQMGSGIAQVMAQSGRFVVLVDTSFDTSSAQLQKAQKNLSISAEILRTKKMISDEAATWITTHVQYSSDLNSLANSELVIEAVNEDMGLKAKILQAVTEVVDQSTILASNTSSISITELAAKTKTPEQCIGMHFMNPVPLMKLVEIIPGLQTRPAIVTAIQDLTTSLQKTPVISRDFPGFVVNRILMPMINEAFNALYESIATARDIDQAMKLGTNQPMGPLELADFIGLDTCFAIMNVLHDGFKDPRYRPSPLLAQYVRAGRLGRKTGIGVFEYAH
jgi:3-hydroxybutyryl-CoA dehydrogenase